MVVCLHNNIYLTLPTLNLQFIITASFYSGLTYLIITLFAMSICNDNILIPFTRNTSNITLSLEV